MHYNESISVAGDWFYIHFIENPGMAFGLEFGGSFGKIALTVFRMVAIVGLGYYLFFRKENRKNKALNISLSLILAGALGNLIDSIFYGVIFSASTPYQLATLFPEGGAYGTWLQGKVVDMLYFPLIESTWPSWVPMVGGQDFIFFRPIFNIADSAISVGVALLVIFQKKVFK